MDNISQTKDKYIKLIKDANSLSELDDVRVKVLGKRGELSLLIKNLGNIPHEQRKALGIELNIASKEVQEAILSRKYLLTKAELEERLNNESVDLTLSCRENKSGAIHPLSQAMWELIDIFQSMGFIVTEGPDIENDFNNFTALNIPEEHPSRQEQDTFYMPCDSDNKPIMLRTHTSPVQVRTMLQQEPPLRIISPGRVYRNDYDQTHTPTFHQIEGLFVAQGLNMGHLKSCIQDFCRRFFEIPDLALRFRPSFFPFTEPSAEVDIACGKQNGELIIGQQDEWLEVLGCGMVNPKVLHNCGIDHNKYQGFAFGVGVERMAMLKYGIPDLRSFYSTDTRWLGHYGFSAFEAFTDGVK